VSRRGEEFPHGLLEGPDRESFVRLTGALTSSGTWSSRLVSQAWSFSATALYGCSRALAGSAATICFQRRKMKSA